MQQRQSLCQGFSCLTGQQVVLNMMVGAERLSIDSKQPSTMAASWRVRAWEAAGEVRDAWEAVVVPLLRRGLPALEQLSLTC